MRQRVLDIVAAGTALFSKRYPVMSLWQTQAENFHVMRADFTRRRYFSEEFGSYLMTGRPARCHRDLMNSFSTMLRRDQWFHAKTTSETINEDRSAKVWLDAASKAQRRAMYDRRAAFVRATKVADGDFCAFGNAVITREVVNYQHLLYRCWHLRDVCWDENVSGVVDTVHFDWRPQARQLVQKFGNSKTGQIASAVTEAANRSDDSRTKEIQCRRMILPADEYDMPLQQTRGHPWISVYVDVENKTILEEVALRTWPCTIPRWEFGGSMWGDQYGYSPAVVYGLPDGRMLQQMMQSMLTASEMATSPPMIAVGEAINGAVNLYAAGITQTDADYDERTGEVLRPLTLQMEGIKYGAEQMERLESALDDSFYLNKLRFPEIQKDMTAYEASKLYEEFIRQSLPLFEPVQEEYNARLVDGTFEDLLALGTFGSVQDMPQILRGRDITWDFDTPIAVAADKALTGAFQGMLQTLVEGAQVDPNVALLADIPTAAREAIDGSGVPAKWLVSDDQFQALKAQKQQQDQAAAAAQQVAQHADVATRVGQAAKSAGDAATSLQGAGMLGGR
jgi:Bacteriophage head to tail connecting protein